MLEVTLALVLIVAGLLYVFMTWNFGYWRKRKVPGPTPRLFIGNYPHMFNMKRHAIYDLDEIYRQYKNKYDAVGIYRSRSPQLLVLNPQLARRVMVSDFKHFHDNEIAYMIDEKSDFIFANNPFSMAGEAWKQRRRDVIPGLAVSRIKSVYPVTTEVCRKMADWLRKQIPEAAQEGIDGKDISLRFTSEMVTDCVLGLQAQSFSDKPTPIMRYIRELFNQNWSFIISSAVVSSIPAMQRFIKLRFVPKPIEHYFVDLMGRAIDARKEQLASGKAFERVDFLDYILELAKKKNLDTRSLTAHTMTFLLDGFDTTATVLSHVLLLLGRNQQAQQKLRDELLGHLGEKGHIEFDKLNELPYLDACVQEAIRIFPPGFLSTKICTEPLELPNKTGNNFVVERGTPVIVPHFCFMTDEEYFPNPQEYQPERFMQPDAAKTFREQGIFMGFGDGARTCIGMRFALAQIKAAMAEIVTNFNFRVNPKTRSDNLFDPVFIISGLKGGIWLDFEQRQR